MTIKNFMALSVAAIVATLGLGLMACNGDTQDGYNQPAQETQTGKLVKKPKIGGPGKPVIGKPKGQ